MARYTIIEISVPSRLYRHEVDFINDCGTVRGEGSVWLSDWLSDIPLSDMRAIHFPIVQLFAVVSGEQEEQWQTSKRGESR